ncbi:MAG: CoA pyrophosphatase [Thaumarchaeota archaeon]|nr:CoA pyrophosphatase [Nitrososphaerota archaeon]
MGDQILRSIEERLTREEPMNGGLKLAAVSVIIRPEASPSVLLIKRAEHSGDPWSGQVAFPGGKVDATDKSVEDAAVRETMEEVGVDLRKSADFLGYSKPFRTHTGTMDVVPSVFKLGRSVEVVPNQEVSSYRWVRLEDLSRRAGGSTHKITFGKESVEMPAVVVEDFVVWGLTYRIVSSLLSQDSDLSEG